MRKKIHSVMAMFVICVIAISVLSVTPQLSVRATSYSGSGTLADPFLITTAEQLQGMSDNLSAHYKLANTIDMAGVDFKPVGRIAKPFTGSFVCDLNTDYTPKYIIKNLKIAVAESAYISEGASKWEAGLFGATQGATISGIYVLDANVSNDNKGGNTGSVVYNTYVPGQDEQSTGILIGDAKMTNVMNCATTGKISAKSNGCGGVIGRAENCTVANSYSMAEVITTGLWNAGGFVANAKDCTFDSCFATGIADAGYRGTADAFCGGHTSKDTGGNTFTNCHATGTLSLGSDRVLWDTIVYTPGGSVPNISTVGVVTDASTYVPQTISQPTVTPDGTTVTPDGTSGTTTGAITNTAGDSVTATKPEDVKALIEALPSPEDNGITKEHEEEVKAAWKAYESMSDGDKDNFDATLSKKLYDCRHQVSLLIAADWIKEVNELPEIDELTLEHVEKILELWEDYQFITDELKKEMDSDIIQKIEDAYAYAEEHADDLTQGTVIEVDNGLTKLELIIVIFCLSMFVLIMAFNVTVGISLSRRGKKNSSESKGK